MLWRIDAVLLTPDDQRRDVDAVQPSRQPWIVKPRIPPKPGARYSLADSEILILVRLGARRRFLAQSPIGISKPCLLVRIDHEDVGFR